MPYLRLYTTGYHSGKPLAKLNELTKKLASYYYPIVLITKRTGITPCHGGIYTKINAALSLPAFHPVRPPLFLEC